MKTIKKETMKTVALYILTTIFIISISAGVGFYYGAQYKTKANESVKIEAQELANKLVKSTELKQ